MQALVVLPGIEGLDSDLEKWEKPLLQRVSGIPLLQRVIATAWKGGASSILVLLPSSVSEDWISDHLRRGRLASCPLQTRPFEPAFDPNERSHWEEIEDQLEPMFLWLPWNWVTGKKILAASLQAFQAGNRQGDGVEAKRGPAGTSAPSIPDPDGPLLIEKESLFSKAAGSLQKYLHNSGTQSLGPTPGVLVESVRSVRQAERFLVRNSGKASDGIYSNFNRRLCWPSVRWLLRTPVTANMITWAGLPLVVLSGYFYAQGHWAAYSAGALTYFLSVLLDEMDGMVARTKFEESSFGCWLETMVDYLGYLFLWAGMTIGLYQEYGSLWWPALGGMTILSNLITFLVLLRQRKEFAPSNQPNQYQSRFYGRLEDDSGRLISRMIRKVVFLAKKGVMCHYILLFSVLGLLPLLFVLAWTGSVLTLFISLYMNRLFRAPSRTKSSSKVSVAP
ncbi:MAG: CDP-alcohol phosphatidyltransferase family protein [Acidobacteriota bacterium]